MPLALGKIVEKIKTWLPKAQAEIEARANELEAKFKEPERSVALDRETFGDLENKIKCLPNPSTYRTAVESDLTEALGRWQREENVINSLVVLSSPVEPIELILKQTLAESKSFELPRIKWLPWWVRPQDNTSICDRLQQAIALFQENASQDSDRPQERELVVIPNLSWCFLRCVDGLEGIERLQDLVFQDSSRFWLIGCNYWAWQYLDRVCHVSAYFDRAISLPSLKESELKAWLAPISASLDLDRGGDRSEEQSETSENWTCKAERQYFERLVEISDGISSVAARLWLHSLYLTEPEEAEESLDGDRAEPRGQMWEAIGQKRPDLPDLPALSQDDRYLLFSLCLHGSMALSDLALSLGEKENKIKSQVQLLRRRRIIELDKGLFRLNPAYYLQLRKDLDDNKFPLGENR